MSEQIDPGIPADVAWRDGGLITVRAQGGSFLRGNLLDLGGEPDGDDEVVLPAASIPRATALIREHELDRRIAPHIPTERAWKAGRRVYVRSPYKSRLGDALYGIGAKWDRDEGALWVGSGKLAAVIPLIEEHEERAAETRAVRDAGLFVKIPYEAAAVRTEAKRLGARWDKDRKMWAMPDGESLARAQVLVREFAEAAAPRKAAAKAARAADRALRGRTPEEIIAASGRTVVPGAEKLSFSGELAGYMKRAEAERHAPVPGDVEKVRGVRYLVLEGSVQFWDEDACADQMPHWEPGWKMFWTGIAVEPADGERAEDGDR